MTQQSLTLAHDFSWGAVPASIAENNPGGGTGFSGGMIPSAKFLLTDIGKRVIGPEGPAETFVGSSSNLRLAVKTWPRPSGQPGV